MPLKIASRISLFARPGFAFSGKSQVTLQLAVGMTG